MTTGTPIAISVLANEIAAIFNASGLTNVNAAGFALGTQTLAQAIAAKLDAVLLGNPGGAASLDFSGKVATAQLPSNLATLDGSGRLAAGQIPPALTQGLNPKGAYNATSNSPTIATGGVGGVKGDVYVVSVAGTVAADSVGACGIGDLLINNGTTWQRIPFSTTLGTMSAQSAASVAITGGSVIGQTQIGFSDGGAHQPSLVPDTAYVIRDAVGNIAFSIDVNGTVDLPSSHQKIANIDTLAVGSFNPSQIGISGDTLQTVVSAVPDLVFPVRDASGNIVSGYGSNGRFSVVGLDAATSITVNGVQVGSGSGAPSGAIDVTLPAYGAVGDAVESFCLATVLAGSPTVLNIVNFSGTLTLAQVIPGVAQLTIVGTPNSGIAFQPYDVGRQLFLSVSGYSVQAAITCYLDGQNVLLAASSITPQSAVTGTATWPCFQSTDVGKSLVFAGMAPAAMWLNNRTAQTGDTTVPYGQQNFIVTISAVTSPTQITVAAAFPYAWAGTPAHLRWGTNDGNAVALAGEAAFNQNKRKIYFPGDGKLYLCLGMVSGGASRLTYIGQVVTEPGAALNGVLWVGDNCRAFVCDRTGMQLPNDVIQTGSDALRISDRRIFGRASFRRCSQLSSINLFITGDSQGTLNPQEQAASWMQIHKFVEEFRRSNPGKTIKVYQMAIGGATYASLADPTANLADGSAPVSIWQVPRPISGLHSASSFMLNANQTGSGAPILPDCVAIFVNGGNDIGNIDGPSMQSLINQIRAISHGDAFGPTDILMQTDHQAVAATTNNGHDTGTAIPNLAQAMWGFDYSAGFIRSSADVSGFGCVDLGPLVTRACFGYDPMHRSMRSVPAVTVTVTPTAPYLVPYNCRDLTMRITLPGASDAAVWLAMKQLDLQISSNRGNRAKFRYGPNGNLWCGVSSWGRRVATTCTIASGGTTLTVAAPTVLASETMTQSRNWTQLTIQAADFTSGMVGQCVVLPTGNGSGQLQRNFVEGFVGTKDLMLQDQIARVADVTSLVGNINVGGAQFIPMDATSRPDVVIFYADGTIFSTTVAYGGYTSATQVTLADPAPQALSAQSVQVFIGRMCVKWFDTGLNLSGLTDTGLLEIDINRGSLMLAYQSSTAVHARPIFDVQVERFGSTFYPLITTEASQSIQINNAWIDAHKPFAATVTPWEIRGIPNTNSDYFAGGVGGHPSSRLRTDVTDVFYMNQDLTTY